MRLNIDLDAIYQRKQFYNFVGSPHYKKLKIKIAEETIFYSLGGLKINNIPYIPKCLESFSVLSLKYKIPKSSIARAIYNLCDDGWIEHTGNTGKNVKYKLLITHDEAKNFLSWVTYSKKISKIKRKSFSVERWKEIEESFRPEEWHEKEINFNECENIAISTWWG